MCFFLSTVNYHLSTILYSTFAQIFENMMTFEGLGIDAKLIQATDELGFVNPTPIQEKAIPELKQ